MRIPKSLKSYFKISSYFVKSLETENIEVGKKNAKILVNKINYIKQSIKMKIDNDRIIELIDDLTNTVFSETENDLYNIDKVEDTTFALLLEDRLVSYKHAYSESNYELVESEALRILKSLNIKHNENSFNTVCKLLLENHIQNLKIIFNKIENLEYNQPQKKYKSNTKKEDVMKIEEEILNSVSLEESYNSFEANLDVSENQKNINKKYFSFLVKFLGKNRDILNLRQKDFLNFKGKLNKEKSAKNQLLSVTTKKRYVNLINKFFKFCYKNELVKNSIEIDSYKVSLSHKVNSKKESYTLDEVKKWYKWALNCSDEEYKWITLIAIFNGFSVSEITRLEKHNIFKKEDIWCLQIEFSETKATKNLNRIRIIPIHQKLLGLGFLDYVNNVDDGFIFKTNNKDFSRKMTDINREFITKNSKKTFHRLRSSFINTLVQNEVLGEHIAALVGHSQEYQITFETYSDKINVRILNEALKKIDYEF